jgi:PST family polysaccharide transporter
LVASLSDSKASYRQILKSTSIVGGATVASLVFGLVRSKILALLVGPAGIGLFGVLNVLFNTGTTVAGLNLQSTGVRQVGATPPDSPERARAETGLWLFAWLAAIIGGFAFWLFERFVYVPSTPALVGGPSFPWIALAVGLSTLNGAQLVLLQVYGKIAAIAYVRLLGAFLSMILAVLAVYVLGTTGLYVAVLAVPLAGIAVAFLWSRGTGRQIRTRLGYWVIGEWRTLTIMGAGLTAASITGNGSQLLLRSIITEQGGLSAAGLFQAAWTLTNVNLSVILSAMAVDYYPRLTALARYPDKLAETLNQQLRIALLLAGPILTFAVGFAPFLIRLLYSDSFVGASHMLQLQIAGDVLKLATWSMGYVLLALNATVGFFVAGATFDIAIVVLVWILYPLIGLDSAGLGYIIALVLSMLVSLLLIARHGIVIDRRNMIWAAALFICLLILSLVSMYSVVAGIGLSLIVLTGTIMTTFNEARRMDLLLPKSVRNLFR